MTLAAIVAASSFASPVAILICGLPMLAIAAAFRRLNRWRVNCGSSSRPGEAIVGFAAVVLTTAIAYLGIRLTAWTQWILIAIEYTGVGILAIWCLVAVFSHNPHSVPFS